MIRESETQWTSGVDPTYSYRVWKGKVWQRHQSAVYYGGYQIKTIPLGTPIANEWLENAEAGIKARMAEDLAASGNQGFLDAGGYDD